MDTYHTSVLLQEAIDLLNIKSGEWYIDATLGGGGHSLEILRHGGRVLGIDVDQEALDWVEKDIRSKIKDVRIGQDLILARGNFRDIDKIARKNGVEAVAGILFDLGVSSHQFDTPERGFSLQKQGPLDMRMDQDLQVKASDLINALSKRELYELFTKLGEERFASTIADRIVRARQIKPIESTKELAEIIRVALPYAKEKIHPATRVFQALRIAVNDELHSLEEALNNSLQLLQNKGRIAVISFHSLEDRIVKQQFRDWEKKELVRSLTKKPQTPSETEIATNPRSRSAKLRGVEKIKT